MTAASPGIIATTMLNAHYDTHEAYVFALAREMRKEYELIAATSSCRSTRRISRMERTVLFQDKTDAEFVEIAEMHVAALNEALASIPRERVRLHCCWGNNEGPHIHDVPLADVLPVLYRREGRRRSASSSPTRATSTNTPRSRRRSCRPSLILLPGVIDTTTNFVEHPEVVANRICEAVDAVGDRTPGHRLERLRLRHLRRLRDGRRGRRLGQAQGLPRGRRHRHPAAVGLISGRQRGLAMMDATIDRAADIVLVEPQAVGLAATRTLRNTSAMRSTASVSTARDVGRFKPVAESSRLLGQ